MLQPFVESGRVRPLASTGASRAISMPNVPTMMESGIADFDLTNWYGLFAPAGTPREIVERLNAEARKAVASPELHDRLAKMGSAVVPGTPEQFAAFIRAEAPRAAEVVRRSGAKVD